MSREKRRDGGRENDGRKGAFYDPHGFGREAQTAIIGAPLIFFNLSATGGGPRAFVTIPVRGKKDDSGGDGTQNEIVKGICRPHVRASARRFFSFTAQPFPVSLRKSGRDKIATRIYAELTVA